MFCKNCGQKLAQGSKFCEACGHPVSDQTAKKGYCKSCKSAFPEDALYCPVCGVKNGAEDVKITSVRPWVRYWARYLDLLIAAITLGLFLGIFMPSVLDSTSEIFLTIIIVLIWVFVEPILLSNWGTTPGKWLLRIQLKDEKGGKPEFTKALNRSFAVWFRGLGLGIPIISLFTLVAAYNRLTKQGVTSWDEGGEFSITHKRIGPFRIIVAILIFTAFALLIYWGES